MTDNTSSIISKVWNFCPTLRDDGVGRKSSASAEIRTPDTWIMIPLL